MSARQKRWLWTSEGCLTFPTLSGNTVEIMHSFKFMGVHITDHLTWTFSWIQESSTTHLLSKETEESQHGQNLPRVLLQKHHRASWPTASLSLMETAPHQTGKHCSWWWRRLIGLSFPAIEVICIEWCIRKACSIVNDPSYPWHGLFTPIPSGCRLQSMSAKFSRLVKSVFLKVIGQLNRLADVANDSVTIGL